MGVFGSSDSNEGKKLEADIASIKTRLDLIAKQLSSTDSDGSTDTPPDLDAKLRAIYTSVQRLGERIEQAPKAPAAPSAPPLDPHVLDTITTDLKQLLGRSDRTTHLELTQRLDAIEAQLRAEQETTKALATALRELIGELRKR